MDVILEPEPPSTNKFLHLFIAGIGPITPLVLQKTLSLAELRKEIVAQQLPVPANYNFIHPNFISVSDPNSFQAVTEPQEHILSTRDYKDDKIVLLAQSGMTQELLKFGSKS